MSRRAAVLALSLAAALAAGCGKKQAAPDVPRNEAGEELLDAEKYKRPIQELESMLYQSELSKPEDASRIAMSAQLLGETIRQKAGQLHEAAGKVSAFAAKLQSESSGSRAVDLTALRGRWELLRHETFTPADWLLHAAGAAPAEEAGTGAAPDAAALDRLREAAATAESLVTVGRAESGRFPDRIDPELSDAQREKVLRGWRDWAKRWAQRLDEAEKKLGEGPPAGASHDWTAARREIARAFAELRGVVADSGDSAIGRRSAREGRFRAAADAVRLSRGRIARLPS